MQRASSLAEPNRTGKRRRGRALALVIPWLFAWSAWAIQPCCEALAAVIPHHPETGAGAAHAQHEHPSHDEDVPAGKDHTHCPSAKPVDLNTPTPAAGFGSSYRVQTFLYPLASQVAPVFVARQPRFLRPRYRPPPPILPPPFLVQRLLL
jgi:hypothetical protein